MPATKVLTICVIAFFLSMAFCADAQLKCKIEHYSTEDGLSHNRIMCMLKDREGFMWFGTWDGLNRFDGHNFVVYKSKPGDTSSLRNNRIENIIEDKAGFLWVQAYDNRVYRFDKKTDNFWLLRPALLSTGAPSPFSPGWSYQKMGASGLSPKKKVFF